MLLTSIYDHLLVWQKLLEVSTRKNCIGLIFLLDNCVFTQITTKSALKITLNYKLRFNIEMFFKVIDFEL